MPHIIIASKNPVKINATLRAFQLIFPDHTFETKGTSVPSGVSDQPMTDNETFSGAKNRATRAKLEYPKSDFWVGIEGGIEETDSEMLAFAWVYIISKSGHGKARTGTFYLPKKVVELIHQGKELGEADDIVFRHSNSKQKSGAVGLLTGDVIDRTALYAHAITLALIPFKNQSLYR